MKTYLGWTAHIRVGRSIKSKKKKCCALWVYNVVLEWLPCLAVWKMKNQGICDVIKQNESKLANIDFEM